jgi:hypothetical protein
MILSYWTLAVALSLSLVAAWYSIIGLTAIFAAAVFPIIVMGGIMEVAKITVTLWLHEYWQHCKRSMKIQLTFSVIVLMFITSMGIFGFLSKAHLDQAVPTGDVAAKVQILDEKIKTERDTIESSRRALAQLDSAVDQIMARSNDEKGAERAVQIRRNQARERNTLQNEIAQAQKKIAAYNEERAPIASELRKVEAEVGPIKYIAALIYGDNPDANLLEKAVRWVIIILVLVFDPLAIMMVLAATESIRWERQGKRGIDFEEDSDITNWFNHAKERARFWDRQQESQDQPDPQDRPKSTRFAGFPWPMTSVFEKINEAKETPRYEQDDGPLSEQQLDQIKEIAKDDLPTGKVIATESLFEAPEVESSNEPELDVGNDRPGDYLNDHEKEKIRAWKFRNPADTIKHQRALFDTGKIDQLPWEDLELHPDNHRQGTMLGFGSQFPTEVVKGDTFLRVDRLPSALYKYNGTRWIEVDKKFSDQYAYDTAYIDHLIAKIDSGEYDPELLSDAERDQIEHRLKNI